MNSLGLTLFQHLCEIGNTIARLRDLDAPASDEWLWHTALLADLDAVVDMLVHSDGIDDDEDDDA